MDRGSSCRLEAPPAALGEVEFLGSKSRVSTTSRTSNNSVEFLGSSPMTTDTRGRLGRRNQRLSPPKQNIRDARDKITPKGTIRDHIQRKKSYSPPEPRVQFDLTNLEEEEQDDDGFVDEAEEEEEEGSLEDEQEAGGDDEDAGEEHNDDDLEVNEDFNFDY